MKQHDRLTLQKSALFQQIDAVESERVIALMQAYLHELIAAERLEGNWSAADQAAIDKGIADLDAGKGISWQDFKKKFARYAV
jgi:hypothetical protein